MQGRQTQGAGESRIADKATGEVWQGLAPPPSHCTQQQAADGLADSGEIRTNREDPFTTQGWDTGLISFINNEPFINKIKTNSQQKNWSQNRIRRFTGEKTQKTDTHMKILDLTHN